MQAHVLKGTKGEIAEKVARFDGVIHEVIVFIDEPEAAGPELTPDQMFAEMEPHTVQVGGADFSRGAIYTRVEGE